MRTEQKTFESPSLSFNLYCYIFFSEIKERRPCSGSGSDVFLSVGEDVEKITGKISSIITKLDAAIRRLSVDEASVTGEAHQGSRETNASVRPEDVSNRLSSPEPLESGLGNEEEVEVGAERSRARASPDAEQTLNSSLSGSNCNKEEDTGTELHVKGQASDFVEESIRSQTEVLDRDGVSHTGKEERRSDWITAG